MFVWAPWTPFPYRQRHGRDRYTTTNNPRHFGSTTLVANTTSPAAHSPLHTTIIKRRVNGAEKRLFLILYSFFPSIHPSILRTCLFFFAWPTLGSTIPTSPLPLDAWR